MRLGAAAGRRVERTPVVMICSRRLAGAPAHAWLSVLALVLCAGGAHADPARADAPARSVLVIESYGIGQPFADLSRAGLSEVLARAEFPVEVFFEHLDVNRAPAGDLYLDHFEALLRAKYAGRPLDVLVACDDDALAFLGRRRASIFPGVPVVFLGINEVDWRRLDPGADVTGVTAYQDRLAAAKTMLRVLPATREIVAIVDDTNTGRAERVAFSTVAPRLPSGVSVRFLSLGDLTMAELGDRLAALPPTSAVLLLNAAVDRAGQSYGPAQSTPVVSRRASVPVFVLNESRVGLGAIGGLVTGGPGAGRAAGDLALAIMRGTDVRLMPIVNGAPPRLLFDYAVLARFGIPVDRLPPGSDVINQPQTFVGQYRTQVIAIAVAFGVVTLFLAILGLEVLRRRRVEVSLRKSQAALAGVLDSVPQGVFWKNREGVYLGCNQVFAAATGLAEPADIAGKTDFDLSWSRDEALAYRADDAEVVRSRRSKRHIVEPLRRADGQVRWIDTSKVPLVDDRGEVYGVLGIFDDITDRRHADEERDRLRDQLQQAAKMEAIGRLAGGVAHDFNNLLTAILGNLEMARAEAGAQHAGDLYLGEIEKAAESAASLTRQLLAFSRRQMVEPRVVNVNDLIVHLRGMLARLIGEDVTIQTTLAPDVAPVRVDPAQFEQALVNLAVNARDAMPDGGTLSIETANIVLDEHYCASHPQVRPGPFVLVAVTDTGSGMTEEVRRRVFEPFFTTKPKGRGTGFGLATTFGTVAQANGSIEVYSEPGLGSTFKIYLPQAGGPAPRVEAARPRVAAAGGRESILLVEDDDAVRLVTKAMLERLGYDVRCAAGGPEALRLTEEDPRPIDLLVTDVVMPGMNGRELAEQLAARFPAMRTLFASGYTEDAVVHRGMVNGAVHFIPKPFSSDGLAAKVRQVLDSPAGH